MGVFSFLIGTKAGRGILISVAVLALLSGAYLKGRSTGKAEGQQQAAQSWSAQLEQARQMDRQETARIIGDANAQRDAAQVRELAALQLATQLAQAVKQIQSERVRVAESVQKLPDSELHGYIVTQLGQRLVGDTAPGYTAGEERALAKCVADYPLCQQENEAKQKQLDAQGKQIAALRDRQEATDRKIDALGGYAARLEASYTTLYNSIPRKVRSWKCFGLWKCGKAKPLPVPDPTVLIGSAPR